MNYTIIIGTNRVDSSSSKVAKLYEEKYRGLGIKSSIISLMDLPIDFSTTNMFGRRNLNFDPIQEQVSITDKFIFIIPEYNGSFPGILKLFIDGCEFPSSFANKKCSLVGVSTGQFGNLRGLEHFTGVANYLKMNVYHHKIYLARVHDQIILDEIEDNVEYNRLINKQIEGFINF